MLNVHFEIAGRRVGPGARPLLIAEVAQAHDGSLGMAHSFIDAIADAGADGVKFQTHIAAAESTAREPWRIKFSRQDASRQAYWRRMEFTAEQWQGLRDHAGERGLIFLSSPFSPEAFALLESLGMAAWKIASGEVSNLPMIRQAAATGKPVLLSSGMSSLEDLAPAVDICRTAGTPVALFQCSTFYPCPPEKTGLNVLAELRDRFQCPVGLSDHSGQIFAGLAATTLGASLVETHVTFSREMFGPDAPASLTFPELRQLADGMTAIHKMLSHPLDKAALAAELAPTLRVFQKCVVARHALPAGTVLAAGDLELKKAGGGLPPAWLERVAGRKLTRPLEPDEPVQETDLA